MTEWQNGKMAEWQNALFVPSKIAIVLTIYITVFVTRGRQFGVQKSV
jgi:hypothetical protein